MTIYALLNNPKFKQLQNPHGFFAIHFDGKTWIHFIKKKSLKMMWGRIFIYPTQSKYWYILLEKSLSLIIRPQWEYYAIYTLSIF